MGSCRFSRERRRPCRIVLCSGRSCDCNLLSARLQPCSCSTVANPSPWPSTRRLVSSSLGHSRFVWNLLLQSTHTLVLHELQRAYLRPYVGSILIFEGLIHWPHPFEGQYRRLAVVYSWNFLFHWTLNLSSKSRSAYFNGMCSEVQHRGGMWAGSLTERVNWRLRHP